MKKIQITMFGLLALLIIASCGLVKKAGDNDLIFIASADMRFYATETYHNTKHTLGAMKAIKEVGPGSFMICPGDFDPPAATYDLVKTHLGEDYDWYPAMGNHELEDEAYVKWLREYNKNGTTLPNIVRKGPEGCEETTYSFDRGDCHFVALNQYFDGESDMGTDGDVVPALLEWLEEDLKASDKKYKFVFGHEPIVSLPDMDNGRIRHQGDSLDKYPKNMHKFYQIMRDNSVIAYVCGHTHSTSYGKINGLWQFDIGHSRGIEENAAPEILFPMAKSFVESDKEKGHTENESLKEYYINNKKQIKKTIFNLKWTDRDSYKKITDGEALPKFLKFYEQYQNPETREIIEGTFWANCNYRKSSFMKFYVSDSNIKLEIYRDDARGGLYTLNETIILD